MRICTIIFCLLLSVAAWAQSGNKTSKDTTIYQLLQRIKSQPGTSDPLVMLNDSIYKGDIHLISSKDIESVDVIKGDDAKQIYGSKAQNGVFLMKTKSYLETGVGYTPGIIDLPRGDGTTQKDTSKITVTLDASRPQNTKPLILVDDKVYKGDIKDINPNDIASVNVMKNAAALTIYGGGGVTGAIVIRTKKYTSRSVKDTSYVIDGELSLNKYDKVDPKDIIGISILKYANSGDKHVSDSNKVIVIVTTKPFAINQYQQKFSAFSKEYKQYLDTHNGGDSRVVYFLNSNVFWTDNNETIKVLYELSQDKIAGVSFSTHKNFEDITMVMVAIELKR